MKTTIRKLLIFLLMVFAAGALHSQTITTTAGSVSSCPGEIVVPVNVTNCNGVGAISLVLNYDNTKLTYLGYTGLNSALTSGLLIINNTGTKVVVSWANTTAMNIGTASLVSFRFTAVTGTSALAWDTQTPGNCEYSDVLGNVLPASFTNGTATIYQSPAVTSQPSNSTILVGNNTSFYCGATGNGLGYTWQVSTNGGSIWTDLTNNSVYSGVTGSTLYITGATLSMNGYQYKCKLTGSCTPVAYSNAAVLTVILPVITSLPTASSCPGSIIVPVNVSNFNAVAAFSLAFTYNTSCLTYTGFQNANSALSGGSMVVNATGGEVFISWSSNAAVTMANGTIIELLFTTVSGTSPLTWDLTHEGYCEYAALSGSVYTSVFNNGNETIHYLPAITGNPADKIIAKTQSTTFSVSATGTGLGYMWQVSTDGGTIYADLANNATYSGVGTATLTVSNAQLAMSGYKYRCKVYGTCTPVVYSTGATLTVLPNIFTTCRSYTGCPGSVYIPITVVDFIGVGAFSLTLNIDPAVLAYTGYTKLHTSLSSGSFVANAVGGKVFMSWSNTTAATIPTNDTIVRLLFTAAPGSATLGWDTQTPGNCEYSDPNGLIIFSTWTNGSATVYSPPALTGHPANTSTYGGGSASFSVSATGTGLTYIWQVSVNGGGSFTNLTNTTPYSGVTGSALTINPAATTMTGYQYRCVVSGTCVSPVTSNAAVLTVTHNAITASYTGVTGSCTGNVAIPVNVTNCTDVGGISLVSVFDTSKMSYEGYLSVNPLLSGGLMAVNAVAGKIYFTWASSTALNLGSGVLLQYRFRMKAAVSTTLSWDNQSAGACEFSDLSGQVITSFYTNATLSTIANALIVNAGPDIIKTGASVQLNGTATGGTLPYTWLWSPAASLSNPNIANPVATPTTTTTYTLTVSVTGCSGTDVMNVIVTGPPENLSVQNVTIPNGTINCYNATNTITVAGSGTVFVVQSGGSATFIAGSKISYLPGTRVYSGGYMRGYITLTGTYCTSPSAPMVASGSGDIEPTEMSGDWCSIYPNPVTDVFTVETRGNEDKTARLQCYGLMGNLVFTGEINGNSKKQFSLGNQSPGIYFIRITRGEMQEIRKVIRN